MRRLWAALALPGCVIVHTEPDCNEHSDCGAAEICQVGRCEATTGRMWMVEIRSADVGWVHPDGLPWDSDFSPPDLYVEFGLPEDACLTSYIPDTFTPVWYEGCEFYVPADPLFFVDLWDVDGAVDEWATGYTWDGASAFTELARTSGTEPGFVDGSGTVTTWIELWPY